MATRLGPARLLAVVSSLLALYSLARVAVLFFEALSTVRGARDEDEALLSLCQAGQASGSAKMREACLKAQAERASPIVFKAIVQAVSTAFKDFSDSVGSPFKMLVVALFLLSSVLLPVIPWARMIIGQPVVDAGQAPVGGVHLIGFAPPPDRRGFVRRKWGAATRRIRHLRRHPRIDELEDEGDVEPGLTTIDVSQGATGDAVVATPNAGWEELDFGGAQAHTKWE